MRKPLDPQPHLETEPRSIFDEGGLRAPPNLQGWRKAWWWFDFIILVKLARLRFIAVLIAIGAVITQWDLLHAYYDKWVRPMNATSAASSDIEWFCPMHPTVIRDHGKEKCPICFMPLSKRKKGSGQAEALPAGVVNRVQLSPYRIVLAGVATWSMDFVPLSKEITAVGFVDFDERGQRKVSARTKGRIDQLFVGVTGQMVDASDPLASLYSPELNVTVHNLVDAQRAQDTSLLRSAQTRLQLLGISDDQIDEILKTGKANSHLTIRSPISGHVIKKYVREGDYVDEGTPLYDIVDLSQVWIQAQVYEHDLAFLPLEQTHKSAISPTNAPQVTATTRAFPNEPFRGALTFVYPHVDQDTRTVTVRCELPNPECKLRPGITATVRIQIPASQVVAFQKATTDSQQLAMLRDNRMLAAPETAVIDTGSQMIVYREAAPGVYEGTSVTLGPKMTGPDNVVFYPVLGGLTSGDRIVTSGSFLVDAETRLNPAAGSIYFGGSGGSSKSGSTVTSVRPSTPEDPDTKIRDSLAKLSATDRTLVEAQRFCPVLTSSRLGSMGAPLKLLVDGQAVFICCEGCKEQALAKPAQTLAQIARAKQRAAGKSNSVTPASEHLEPPAPVPSHTNVLDPPTDDLLSIQETQINSALEQLAPEDRALAESQRYCTVLPKSRLGSMGVPVKLMLAEKPVFLCCKQCTNQAQADPQGMVTRVDKQRRIHAALAKLNSADRKLAEAQGNCILLDNSPLGSMGTPIKVMVAGQPVFICCKGCRDEVLAKPQEMLKKLDQRKSTTPQ